ncbi:hypothetical protein TNCV_1552001 [Trichonephila clavipes]|nr:hypothetical protein TNCV_1552001 [Trichonephila clavipes]
MRHQAKKQSISTSLLFLRNREYNTFLHPRTNLGDNHFGAQNKRPSYGRDRFQDFKFSSKSGAKSHYHSWEKDEGTELCRSKCARDKLRCDSSRWREKRRAAKALQYLLCPPSGCERARRIRPCRR